MSAPESYTPILKDLANTMLGVARESVTLLKRSDQEQALKLTKEREWGIYLEFVRLMFNLVDRLSAFHISIQDQREFMNSLEDSVAEQLNTVLAPTLSASEVDDMEVTLSIGQTVAESRQTYERFRFDVTQESKDRNEYFQFFSERVAAKAGVPKSKELTTASFLCASAVVPAFQKLFEDAVKPGKAEEKAQSKNPEPVSSSQPTASDPSPDSQKMQTIKLISVVSKISGEEVETRWGVHPKFQRDLLPEEAKELAQHMNRVARIVGERFAVVASLAESTDDQQQVGHA